MAKAKKKVQKKAKKKVAAKGRKKPAARKPPAKRKKPAVKATRAAKPKRKVSPAKKAPVKAAAGETVKLREEVRRWQDLHTQLQEQIRIKDSRIAIQMQEIMELKKTLEQLKPPAQ
jgi:hypothetical protein